MARPSVIRTFMRRAQSYGKTFLCSALSVLNLLIWLLGQIYPRQQPLAD